MKLPETITVTRSITYNVPDIISLLKDSGENNIDIENIMEHIEQWVEEDMAAPISNHDLVYRNENGDEL